MPSTKYTREVLEPIVRSSYSLADVLRELGLPLNGGNHRLISARIRHARVDSSHFGQNTIAARCAAVPQESLEQLIRVHTSLAELLREVGLPTEGRAHHEMSARIKQLGFDTSHFRGQGWARGETRSSHPSVDRFVSKREATDAEIFIENSTYLSGRGLVRRLLAKDWKYSCSWCEIVTWRGQPLVLHLDHINGISNDNRFENLRLLPELPLADGDVWKSPSIGSSCYTNGLASVAKLVSAIRLGRIGRKPVGVRVPPLAQL
jgi:hypothetical protein